MEIATFRIQLQTKGYNHIVDITDQVQEKIGESGLKEGTALISGIGSTVGITTLEYEPGLVETDVHASLDKLAPYGVAYVHNQTWGDDNGAAHLRSAIVGTSQSIPFERGALILGTWQQIVFMDFDTRSRSREVVVQLWGK